MENVTLWLAFSGGFLSFISPCCLPLYPSFLSYITGMSVNELKQTQTTMVNLLVVLHASAFLLGFSIIFYILGFSATWIGQAFAEYTDLIRMLGGIFILIMGLFLLGWIKPTFMMREFRLPFKKANTSLLNSLIVGMVFSAGWTPCIGPIFSSIIATNMMEPDAATTFLNVSAYSLGFSIPFLVMAFLIGKIRLLTKHSSLFMKAGGMSMVALGILLYTNKMTYINVWFSSLTS